MSQELHLDWSAAEVRDGELTVPLVGELPKRFKPAFRHTVRLLGEHPGWGAIELHKGTVQVADVQAGSEEALRHHLDSVVTQANAAVAADEQRDGQDEEAPQGPDAEMTARFRAFAPAESADR